MNEVPDLRGKLHDAPPPAPRQPYRRVLDAAEQVLAQDGPDAFTTSRVAQAAGIKPSAVTRCFPDRHAIVAALAVGYWSDFEDLVAGVAELDEREPLADPTGAILETLAAGFRARPGFRALWYGGLRTEEVRDATRPTRTAIARSVARILAVHWPAAGDEQRLTVARMLVLAGDGLLREAFRVDPEGDPAVLDESRLMLDAYARARLAA